MGILSTQENVNWNKPDKRCGFTVAIWSVAKNNIDMVTLLLGVKGIDWNYTNYFGTSALNLALRKNYTDIVKMLVGHPNVDKESVDWNKQDHKGNTTAMIAVINYDFDMLR